MPLISDLSTCIMQVLTAINFLVLLSMYVIVLVFICNIRCIHLFHCFNISFFICSGYVTVVCAYTSFLKAHENQVAYHFQGRGSTLCQNYWLVCAYFPKILRSQLFPSEVAS